ncbi:hypothetical protein BH10CYA1_BH10CYA1_18340 [soil metagenome]
MDELSDAIIGQFELDRLLPPGELVISQRQPFESQFPFGKTFKSQLAPQA